MICAFELKLLHGLNVEALHTFGQPRVGNYAFAKAVQELVPPKKTVSRIEVRNLFQFLFTIHDLLICRFGMTKDLMKYRICSSTIGENKDCSSKCGFRKCNSIEDHYNYLNVDKGKRVHC
uniref:AlNc14C634G12304 protein n=1 Tax=Albugo laibachii Nc14 TaxID=890382 RepID=F0X1K0_9STRA|nr:AlNc14C634G12304 [Albugo laibachii Nc14]|eukprot:CCA27691.1 AlNc14C634G12304 [Albugo laibachii Nc14]